jgi:6-pyruvoyltetrahydropterin/6-carboxytetrahydropterin synthase
MYELGIRRSFSATHYLIGGDWGAENVEHSHEYRLEVVLGKNQLDRHGFLVDIVEVEDHLDQVVAQFRGKTLNDLPGFTGANPSIERLAAVIHECFRLRFADYCLSSLTVVIWEDDIAWTSYRGSF